MVLIEEKTENKILEEHKEIIEFKKIYTKIRYLKKFYNNQPIEYKLNPVLFFYHMINLIMDIFLLEDKKSDIITISFNNEALEQIIDIKDYINNTLLYNLKNYKIYTNEIDMLIKLFIYYIDSKINFNLPIPFDNCIIKKNEANLTKKYTEEFVEKQKKNKKTFLNELKIEENKFIIGNANSCIPFKYSNYEASLLDKIIKARSTKNLDIIRYKYMYISEFQRDNFFDENELIYLKDIFRDIINSRCFDELFSLYSDYKFLPLNILKNKSIQDYIIDNIMFLPYDEKMFDTQSFTFSFNGQICLSGYPFCSTVEYKDQKVYHILELARKLIQLMHEYCHAIKRYLNIVTNGLIYSETYDEKNNKEEAGFLFEYILFGWEHNDYFNNNICYDNNRILWKQKIDVNTALKMLNIDLYNYDISSIQDILYNNKNSPSYIDFENKKINEKLVKFLFDLGFDTKEKINILKKNKSTIKVSRNEQNYNLIDVGSEGRNHINKHA